LPLSSFLSDLTKTSIGNKKNKNKNNDDDDDDDDDNNNDNNDNDNNDNDNDNNNNNNRVALQIVGNGESGSRIIKAPNGGNKTVSKHPF
jgi:hypothetical protein